MPWPLYHLLGHVHRMQKLLYCGNLGDSVAFTRYEYEYMHALPTHSIVTSSAKDAGLLGGAYACVGGAGGAEVRAASSRVAGRSNNVHRANRMVNICLGIGFSPCYEAIAPCYYCIQQLYDASLAASNASNSRMRSLAWRTSSSASLRASASSRLFSSVRRALSSASLRASHSST